MTAIIEYLSKSPLAFSALMYYLMQVVAATAIFASRLRRRDKFVLRLILFTAAFFVAGYLLTHIIGKYILGMRSITVYIVAIFCLWGIFDHKIKDIIFCVTAAFAVQNSSANIESIFLVLFTIDWMSWQYWLMGMLVFAAVTVAAYFICARQLKVQSDIDVRNITTLLFAITTICVVVLLQFWLQQIKLDRIIPMRIAFLFCCVMVLFIMFGFLDRNNLKRENAQLERLLQKEGRQYEVSKRNMEILNIKCHDLKRQIAALQSISDGDKENVNEIAEAVMIHDNALKTGNKVLDVILFEKGLYCESNSIKLSTIADGAQLNFMGATDVASLFGNALDNAIECVEKYPETEKRVINLRIFSKGSMISVHLENYCEVPPSFVGGVPVTSKEDTDYHGFGVKSMQYIVRKYGGSITMDAGNDMFVLNIVIPTNKQ